jgi:hypothetical protein
MTRRKQIHPDPEGTLNGQVIGGGLEMRYDCIWFCPTLKRDDWSEYYEMLHGGRRLEAKHMWCQYLVDVPMSAVRLCAGEAFQFDEIYLFLAEADARRFFEGGPLEDFEESYRDREFAIDGHPIGFVERSLYLNGENVISDLSGRTGAAPKGPGYRDRCFLRSAPAGAPRPRTA